MDWAGGKDCYIDCGINTVKVWFVEWRKYESRPNFQYREATHGQRLGVPEMNTLEGQQGIVLPIDEMQHMVRGGEYQRWSRWSDNKGLHCLFAMTSH